MPSFEDGRLRPNIQGRLYIPTTSHDLGALLHTPLGFPSFEALRMSALALLSLGAQAVLLPPLGWCNFLPPRQCYSASRLVAVSWAVLLPPLGQCLCCSFKCIRAHRQCFCPWGRLGHSASCQVLPGYGRMPLNAGAPHGHACLCLMAMCFKCNFQGTATYP